MIHRLHWHRDPGNGPYSPLSSLAPYLGQDVSIEVLPHQTALLLRHHEIRAAFLPNLHRIHVRDRRGRRPDTVPSVAAVREVGVEDALIFLHLSSFSTSLSGPPRETGSRWNGVAHLRVTEPRRFYESFLRHTEDLPTDQFETICRRLMGEIAGGHPNSLATLAARDTLFARIGVKLRSVGLRLERLDQEPAGPTESSRDALPLVTSAGKL